MNAAINLGQQAAVSEEVVDQWVADLDAIGVDNMDALKMHLEQAPMDVHQTEEYQLLAELVNAGSLNRLLMSAV